jgi:hypothetical protein
MPEVEIFQKYSSLQALQTLAPFELLYYHILALLSGARYNASVVLIVNAS